MIRKFNGMQSQSHGAATWWIHCHDSRARYATLQGAVTWRNHCHDRATFQGVIIPATILKVVFCRVLFIYLCFNAVWALTSGGFCHMSVRYTCTTLIDNVNTYMCKLNNLTRRRKTGFIHISLRNHELSRCVMGKLKFYHYLRLLHCLAYHKQCRPAHICGKEVW